jgi:hypothetical protein
MTSSAMIFERIIIDRNGDSLLNLRLKQSEPVLLAETIPYIVSSNALRATSPYFAAIFQNSFSESKAGFDGKFHFEAFDFTATALKYFLIALHTPAPGGSLNDPSGSPKSKRPWHGPRLPCTLHPKMLVEIAEIMGYYHVPALDPVIVGTWFNVCLDKYAPDFDDWPCLDDQLQEQLMMWLHLGIAYKIRSLCDQTAEMIYTT